MSFNYKFPSAPSLPFVGNKVTVYGYNQTADNMDIIFPVYNNITVVKMNDIIDNTNNNINIYLKPDVSNAQLGSIVYFFAKVKVVDGVYQVNINFNQDSIYFVASTGGYEENININNYERVAFTFVFDGEKLCSTYPLI